jgi:carotenoid cleavage dioxygenase-like enzyme
MDDLFRPVASELSPSAGMLLDGAIPADFPGGAILKNGPNPKYEFIEGQGGWLDGDGSQP